MDRALKERLIGAIVLVVVAVLIVPVFLDGPSGEDEILTERVTLPGQNDQPRTQQTIVLRRDRDEPVPAQVAEPAAEKVEVETPAERVEVETPASEEKSVPQPVARKTEAPLEKVREDTTPAPQSSAPESSQPASNLWAVQLGSFSSRANAEKLAADLRADGYAAFLSGLATGNGQLHRVRIGPQKDRKSAEGVASTLAAAGHKGQVVTHP